MLSLPGANGLDLNLSVRYNSDDAVISNNEFADTNETVRKINFNSFAAGWSFGFPTIIKSNVKKNYGFEKQTQLRFPDGSAYKIKNDNDNPSSNITLTLEFYKLFDMTLVREAATKNYVLTYTDGRVITFDGTYGNIKQIKDIHNNTIDFEYTELDYFRGSFTDYIFKPSYYSAKINALTGINDSAGRDIVLDYDIDTTAYGKEVRKITVKMNNITYATLNLDRVKSYCGNADVLTQITDAEYNVTKYEYKEKFTHIYNQDIETYNPTYTVSGSVFALEKVSLPTGGSINYEYEKARRAYAYFIPQVIVTDWYEVYKISKVSDSSGFERTYEYENDQSGYPYGRLDVEPIMPPGWWYTGTPTGNITALYSSPVSSANIQYHCIIRQNGVTTITTFNNQHNKINEQTYTDSNTQNSYTVGNGTTKWQAMIGNYVYHIGYLNSADASVSSGKLFIYKQSIVNGEISLLPSYDTNIPSSALVRSNGNFIYVFYQTGSGTSKKFIAKPFNTANGTWGNAMEYTFTDATVAGRVSLNNLYFANGAFYSFSAYPTGTPTNVYHTIYNPSTNTWTAPYSSSITGTSGGLTHLCTNGTSAYYKNGRYIFEYNFTTKTATRKDFGTALNNNFSISVGGFSVGSRTFIFAYDRVSEFNFSTGTLSAGFLYSASSVYQGIYNPSSNYTTYNYCSIYKGTDDQIYYVANSTLTNGLRPIYRFKPDASDKFELVGNRLINNRTTNVFAGGTSGAPVFYMVSDGTEKVNLFPPSSNQAMMRTENSYNSYNQLTSSIMTRANGTETHPDTITQAWTYVAGKSILSSHTDALGNKTAYEYTNSTYFIPTKITQFADTPNAVVTTNTLSQDKKKIDQSSTVYSDRTFQTVYTYTHPTRSGNVTEGTVTEIKGGSSAVVSSATYDYDTTGTLVASVTSNGVVTNDVNFL